MSEEVEILEQRLFMLTMEFNSLKERLEPFLQKMENEEKQRQLAKDYYFPEKNKE
jgi:hypothetical protein